MLAALEAVVGLFIEVSIITQAFSRITFLCTLLAVQGSYWHSEEAEIRIVSLVGT